MACALLHTHCSLFLIIAQQVKNHYSVLFYCFFSVILQQSCDLRYLQSGRMISEQKKCPQKGYWNCVVKDNLITKPVVSPGDFLYTV